MEDDNICHWLLAIFLAAFVIDFFDCVNRAVCSPLHLAVEQLWIVQVVCVRLVPFIIDHTEAVELSFIRSKLDPHYPWQVPRIVLLCKPLKVIKDHAPFLRVIYRELARLDLVSEVPLIGQLYKLLEFRLEIAVDPLLS